MYVWNVSKAPFKLGDTKYMYTGNIIKALHELGDMYVMKFKALCKSSRTYLQDCFKEML